MGVSGCGKSSLAEALAGKLEVIFIDGDSLHPPANINKMSKGKPLTDADRMPWLEIIGDTIHNFEKKGQASVIVCSALKKQYRDQLRVNNKHVQFLFLKGSYQLILNRMKSRAGHFMKPDMLQSQFDTLEIPDHTETDVMTLDINNSIEELIEQVTSALD